MKIIIIVLVVIVVVVIGAVAYLFGAEQLRDIFTSEEESEKILRLQVKATQS